MELKMDGLSVSRLSRWYVDHSDKHEADSHLGAEQRPGRLGLRFGPFPQLMLAQGASLNGLQGSTGTLRSMLESTQTHPQTHN